MFLLIQQDHYNVGHCRGAILGDVTANLITNLTIIKSQKNIMLMIMVIRSINFTKSVYFRIREIKFNEERSRLMMKIYIQVII